MTAAMFICDKCGSRAYEALGHTCPAADLPPVGPDPEGAAKKAHHPCRGCWLLNVSLDEDGMVANHWPNNDLSQGGCQGSGEPPRPHPGRLTDLDLDSIERRLDHGALLTCIDGGDLVRRLLMEARRG